MNNKILACIDHSSYFTSVCDYAAWAAVRLGAPLEFIHVLDRHPEKAQRIDFSGSIGLGAQENLLTDLSNLDEQRSKVAQEAGRQLIQAAKQCASVGGVSDAEGRQRSGELLETLAEMEESARLFVLGKRGETAGQAVQHLGSNLERVARALHRPILVVTQAFQAPDNFMIAFDGSATTRKGVEMIASSPLFQGLPCHVVMAATSTPTTEEHLQWAQNTLRGHGFDVVATMVDGDAEKVLSDYVKDRQIDVLVMGAYGHSRIRQLLVGSTATTMLRTSSIPVLLLR